MLYIAFLRAINVGGHTVKMAQLRELFAELSFANVRTYIQSGNVFFETDETDRAALTSTIERHLHKRLGYAVGTILRTIPEVEATLARDPFRDIEVTPDVRLFIQFVAGTVATEHPFPLKSPKEDVVIVGATPGEVFFLAYVINGRLADPTKFIASTFGLKANQTTTRFFGTTAKIVEAAKQGQ